MFYFIKNFFTPKPHKDVFKKLEQGRLLISRLNDDVDFSIPKARSLVKKHYKDFNDELDSTFEALLLVNKKNSEYKELLYEIEPWFEQKLVSATELIFSVIPYFSHEQQIRIWKNIIKFYRENK